MSDFESKVILTKNEYDDLIGKVKELAEENNALKKDNHIHIVLKTMNEDARYYGSSHIENVSHVENVDGIVEKFINESNSKVRDLESQIKHLERELRDEKKHVKTYQEKVQIENKIIEMTKDLDKIAGILLDQKGEN